MISLSVVWPDLASFLRMGGHGPFVWGAYAAAVVLVAAELAHLVRKTPR